MRTFASWMDLSQSAVFWPLFPGNWLLGHSVSGQMKPNHCPWNFRHLTWRFFYYSPAECGWFYQYSLFGVFITPRGKSRKKKSIFIFLCWVTAENTLYQNAEHLYESVSLCYLCFTRAGILILNSHHVRTSVAIRTKTYAMPTHISVAIWNCGRIAAELISTVHLHAF